MSQNEHMHSYWVYILATQRNGTLYIGVTNDIKRRVYEHKNKSIQGFTKKYDISLLVYIEEYSNIQEALYREKQLKNWHRKWKLDLINNSNPNWIDLYDSAI